MRAWYLGTQWPSRLVVLATGAVVGFCIWKTCFDYVPHLYPLLFKQGQWLVAADAGPQGYFRKKLSIPAPVQEAWIMAAATDSFILYVNGKAVDANAYASMNVSGIYDIRPYLHSGKNVLGILVRRRSYPGAAMAVLEGAYLDQTGHEHWVATDASWKFAPIEQRQGNGDILWHSELFDDAAWSPARTAGHPGPSEAYPLVAHPLAFTLPPQGKWVGRPSPQTYQATFSHALTLFNTAEEAWIRIAATSPYSLVVNGVAVTGEEASKDSDAMRLVQLQRDPIWSNAREGSTDLYQIAPLLRPGANHLTVSTDQRSSDPPGLFVDGFLISRGKVLTFGSDATWSETSPSYMANGQDLKRYATTVLADRDLAGPPLPVKKVMTNVLPVSYMVKQSGRALLVMSLTMGLIFVLWKVTSRLLHALQKGNPAESSGLDALAHLPMLLIFANLILLSFDVRFNPSFPFQPWTLLLGVAALLLFKAALLLEALVRNHWHLPGQQYSLAKRYVSARYFYLVVLIGLIIAGAILRLDKLDTQSFYHDEVTMVANVKGLLEKGYPNKMLGPIEIPLSTYELMPYPIALSAILLGWNDFALRLPAALFGIMTIPLIYSIGKKVFDQRVGLLAAAIYTFCPQALIWAKYLWHPQQTQFFALLTSYFFYRAIRPAPMSPAYLYLATLSFILTYLSWEGAGFLLPALGLGLLVVKGQDSSWLRDKHLWIVVSLVLVAVALQLTRRILLLIPYLVVGTGLSDVSFPIPFFLDPMYDPTFYIKNFLWLENNALLTLLLLAGLPFLFTHRGIAYYVTLLLSVLFMMANLLQRSTIRYVYYLQPFLILSAAAVALSIVDCISNIVPSFRLWISWLLRSTALAAAVALIVLGSSLFLKLYRLNDFAYITGIHTRPDSYYSDYRSSAQYVQTHYQAGDLVIVVMPETLKYYGNVQGTYFVQDYTKMQVLYDPVDDSPRYLERMTGIPTIRNFDELQNVLSQHRRTWIVAVPHGIFAVLSGYEITDYIYKHGKVVYESYDARIYLLQS